MLSGRRPIYYKCSAAQHTETEVKCSNKLRQSQIIYRIMVLIRDLILF